MSSWSISIADPKRCLTTMMIHIRRTDSSDPDFRLLVRLLDADLAVRDGDDHAYYAQFNTLDRLQHAIVPYASDQAVACGAFKPFDPVSVEVKRMYTKPEHRGEGLAARVLSELEKWANELAYSRCVLETGKMQPEALSLYQRSGYRIIPNYGPYVGVENSVCFEKPLTHLSEEQT